MTVELVIKLIGIMAWPLVATMSIIVFRKPLIRMMRRISKIRAGGVGVDLDVPKTVELLKNPENRTPEQLAELIQQFAIVDVGEQRILRALLGESKGRSMNNYKEYYGPALSRLMSSGKVRLEHGKYFITATGIAMVKPHVMAALHTNLEGLGTKETKTGTG